ncbi:MAG: cupin domain-containing protein [Dehalococcoidales bacterium]
MYGEVNIIKVCNYSEVKPIQELPGVTKREVINADDGAPNFCMRVFEVEPGSSTPSHSHSWEHEVYILSGRGVVIGEQEETQIAAGSVVFVPPNEHHCFANNSNEPLRFICLIPLLT